MPREANQDHSSLLDISNLHVHFPIREGLLHRHKSTVKAVNGVSLKLNRGEIFGLVGESGCGKTTLGRAVVGLTPITSGGIVFTGENIVGLTGIPAVDRSGYPSPARRLRGRSTHPHRSATRLPVRTPMPGSPGSLSHRFSEPTQRGDGATHLSACHYPHLSKINRDPFVKLMLYIFTVSF